MNEEELRASLTDTLTAIQQEHGEIAPAALVDELERIGIEGDLKAHYCLSLMYLLGQGVDLSLAHALMWINIVSLTNRAFPNAHDVLTFISRIINAEERATAIEMFNERIGANQRPQQL